MSAPISDELRRFIAALPSVPCLEAIMLLRAERGRGWDAKALAARLFIDAGRAGRIIAYLVESGIAEKAEPAAGMSARCRYRPASAELGALLDRVADCYAHHLVEVTRLIHARSSR